MLAIGSRSLLVDPSQGKDEQVEEEALGSQLGTMTQEELEDQLAQDNEEIAAILQANGAFSWLWLRLYHCFMIASTLAQADEKQHIHGMTAVY
eukprot:Skav207155  [mRNA]  locus=scaffold573:262205:263322:+ [translate_table: standard]